jgi:hypothetical protein
MHKRRVLMLLFIIGIIVMTIIAANGRSTANDAPIRGVDARLERILSNQERILNKLDGISAELKIVKIRATR